MKFDLHVHTTFSSCSDLTLEQIISHAKAKKLDGVCITDHDTMAVKALVPEGRTINGLSIIVGMEYATPSGDFLVFGPFDRIAPKLSAVRLLDYVRQHKGVAVAAHPFREGRRADVRLLAKDQCPLMEGKNGRNSILENKQAEKYARDNGIAMVGGSDAHSIDELGRVTTDFYHSIHSSRDLVWALERGCFSMDGASLASMPLEPSTPLFA